jgi:hypothetical protein
LCSLPIAEPIQSLDYREKTFKLILYYLPPKKKGGEKSKKWIFLRRQAVLNILKIPMPWHFKKKTLVAVKKTSHVFFKKK